MAKEEARPAALEGRCRWGSQSPNPCSRQATIWLEPEGLVYPVCDEHTQLRRCGAAEEELFGALDTLSGWIASLDKHDLGGALGTVAMHARDELVAQYGAVAVKMRAARLIADQGPPRGELSPAKAEELVRLMIQSDALNNARAIIEDAPEDLIGVRDRWEIAAALDAAHDEAHKDLERYRAEIGLRAE